MGIINQNMAPTELDDGDFCSKHVKTPWAFGEDRALKPSSSMAGYSPAVCEAGAMNH